MALIQRVLEYVEERGNGNDLKQPDWDVTGDPAALSYYWELCEEAGYIRASHVTWSGHDRLDEFRDRPAATAPPAWA